MPGIVRRLLGGSFFALIASSILPLTATAANDTAIPDFSGPWGRNVFNMESPEAGPGPVVNLRRLGKDAGRTIVDGDPVPLVGDYNNPILKPEAAAVVKRNGELSESGHDFPDPSNQCGAQAPPFLFSIQLGMQLVQTKDQVVILYNQDNQVRRVRLNSSHPRSLKPTPMGDSIGRYDEDTLVIDTVGIKVAPYSAADRFGTPVSEAMHVVERYRLVDANEAQAALASHAKTHGFTVAPLAIVRGDKALQVEVMVDDPQTFTSPWTGYVSYMRVNRPFPEGVCAQNNVDPYHLGDFRFIPTATAPDF